MTLTTTPKNEGAIRQAATQRRWNDCNDLPRTTRLREKSSMREYATDEPWLLRGGAWPHRGSTRQAYHHLRIEGNISVNVSNFDGELPPPSPGILNQINRDGGELAVESDDWSSGKRQLTMIRIRSFDAWYSMKGDWDVSAKNQKEGISNGLIWVYQRLKI